MNTTLETVQGIRRFAISAGDGTGSGGGNSGCCNLRGDGCGGGGGGRRSGSGRCLLYERIAAKLLPPRLEEGVEDQLPRVERGVAAEKVGLARRRGQPPPEADPRHDVGAAGRSEGDDGVDAGDEVAVALVGGGADGGRWG